MGIGLQYQNNFVPLLLGFSPSLYSKSLLLPAYWKSSHHPHNEYFFHAGMVCLILCTFVYMHAYMSVHIHIQDRQIDRQTEKKLM